MLKIDITRHAAKALKRLPPKQGRQVAQKIMALRENPCPNDMKKLTNTVYLRVDVGEYRVIYFVDKKTLKIVLVGKRNDGEVYKKLKRLS